MDGKEPLGSIAPELAPLLGDEPFVGTDATVIDFWRFALSDTRVNVVRGWLAEFIVARALGVSAVRVEWDHADIVWNDHQIDGRPVAIDVKSSGYMQVWRNEPSKITFGGLAARTESMDGSVSDDISFKLTSTYSRYRLQQIMTPTTASTSGNGRSLSCLARCSKIGAIGESRSGPLQALTSSVGIGELRHAIEQAVDIERASRNLPCAS